MSKRMVYRQYPKSLGWERVHLSFSASFYWKILFALVVVIFLPKPVPLFQEIKMVVLSIPGGPLWGLPVWLYFTLQKRGREWLSGS